MFVGDSLRVGELPIEKDVDLNVVFGDLFKPLLVCGVGERSFGEKDGDTKSVWDHRRSVADIRHVLGWICFISQVSR